MTERQDLAAAPAPWSGAGGPVPAAPEPSAARPGGASSGGSADLGGQPAATEQGPRTPGQGSAGPGEPGMRPLWQPAPAATESGNQAPTTADREERAADDARPAPVWARPANATTGQAQSGPGEPEDGDEPYARVDARKLEAALLGLRKPVVSVPLVLEAPDIEAARAERLKLLSQIDDYLLPRLRQSGAPILVALVGSTGAGKSTLLNTIVGRQVSATGIRRPTTNSPVLACHPNDMRWFAENVFLPTLPRVRQQGLAMPGRDGLLVLAAAEGMPEGVAVLDTPDIDSVVKAHRDFANQFLDASDLWLFVTTARRYADAAVWGMLKDARNRGAALAVALSRVPPSAAAELAAHFDAMLDANGLREVRRFIIPETIVTEAQLPGETATPIKEYLADTARRDDRRVAVLTQTMSGVLDTFRDRVPALADHAAAQLAISRDLQTAVATAYSVALAEFDDATRNGSLLRGEVMARWQDFAGTGDLLKALQVRRARGQAGKGKKQRLPARAAALRAALDTSLEALISAMADRAAEEAVAAWRENPAGAALMGGTASADPAGVGSAGETDFVASALADLGILDTSAAAERPGPAELGRPSPGLAVRAERAVSTWQDHVQQLVRAENVTKRSIARVVSFDDASLALVLAIGVLGYGASAGPGGSAPWASPDGAPAEGTSEVPQRLLTSLFGAGLMRDIGVRVRQDLHNRVSLLFEEESRRFVDLIERAGRLDETISTELLQAGFTLEDAR
jgi:energy-coupling factor transporter ATP-binding protein EcfA2